ncbi:Peroxisomal acyl-coenzyme A oxidase 1 [Phytophthora ramorum]|uniref:Peroxisomal acyl-coenzyme A oxidase 1 n=1 Tax=Phytophthora ramorum TaxID=164328 RepID=UPI00309BFBC5|nr:Peroxisomal acyl-coenzyme A oxidase 1 [Phytophthora ramorum]
MLVELKDLAPLLLKKERVNGDIDPAVLTNLLRGGEAANDRRKQLIKVIEQHPVLSDRDMMYRNHSERYNVGLKKAFHYVELLQNANYTDEEQAILLGALGEQVPFDLHRGMFIPTIESQGTDNQRAKWLPLAKNYKIIGAYAQTELDVRLRCKAHIPEKLGDFQVLLEAFRVRATRALRSLAESMQATTNDSNACMLLMTHTSVAHTELMLLESFMRGIENLPVGNEKTALANLCSLFGAWLINKSLGDFRQHDYLSSNQVSLVHEQIVRLLPIVRKSCILLTDAWDFTNFELNSTIGDYNGDIYRAIVKRVGDEPLNQTDVAEGYEEYLKPLIQSGL